MTSSISEDNILSGCGRITNDALYWSEQNRHLKTWLLLVLMVLLITQVNKIFPECSE